MDTRWSSNHEKSFTYYFIYIYLFFFLVFAYQAQAEEENEWYVNDFGTFVVAAVSGEVVHGDKLRFFIKKEDCSKVSMMFSFSTSLKKDEIKELSRMWNSH